MTPEPLSFEAHITVEPVFGERFDAFSTACSLYGFRPAELLLRKQRSATPERSDKDSFCTGHDRDYAALHDRMERLVWYLQQCGFQIWRRKIEGILLDVRTPPLIKIADPPVQRVS